ncbi:hypothetical protein LCGC14_0254290 [marine sediment metagenome]|uniref:Ferrous iron transport protein B n=1 Tax=marine sediment metagenome TaxID=412755 RepID=A0A0F9X8G9_9ZZZZ|nr:ferrous iron transport protein B [Phycisphaerae bacterium]HDZ45092.1 ferrous iron transport protein B [Phycisphaerae bacterium]
MADPDNSRTDPQPAAPDDQAPDTGGKLSVALAGNPNSGKTTIFNAITGARQHVGNYPGVTVEKKEGSARYHGQSLHVIDLPGTYSLTAYSIEEVIARNVLIDDSPDVVIDILDSSNLERNLYLATQLLELGVPLVLAFNMSDVAKTRGFDINIDYLSRLLGVPIVQTVGHKGRGIRELLRKAVHVGADPDSAVDAQRYPDYGHEIEPHVQELAGLVVEAGCGQRHARWFAVKMLENDEQSAKRLHTICGDQADAILARATELREHIESIFGDSAEIVLADRRYGFISGACTESVEMTVDRRHTISDRIDMVMTNRWLGLPIFAVLMYAMFSLTFALGNPLVDSIGDGQDWLAGTVSSAWPPLMFPLLKSLVVDGLIKGVGGVLVFVPVIVLLFLAIAFLEDTGYMARAAFIMDRLMHKLGLHGKSFIPMLIGFGCSVPAIMATRTLETRRDRLTTMMVVPLMSCGARMPIYAIILPAFFSKSMRAPMLWLIYTIGILLAIILAKVLRVTLLRGKRTPFVMELPPYRMPTLRGLLTHVWERTWMYLRKAGTIILAATIVVWAMSTFPRTERGHFSKDYDELAAQVQRTRVAAPIDDARAAELDAQMAAIDNEQQAERLSNTVMGRLGHLLTPVMEPLGFDWKIATGFVSALPAKEVFVAQMGVIYALGETSEDDTESLQAQLHANYTPLVGFCIMLYALISAPCIATLAVTKRESGSWRWALLQFFGLTALAYVVTLGVYQVGRLFVG